jgi:hypothetical protein
MNLTAPKFRSVGSWMVSYLQCTLAIARDYVSQEVRPAILQGRRNRGAGGASAPPLWREGGLSPLIFPNTHINTIIIHDTLRLVGSKNDCQNASETFSETLNFQNFLGEHAPGPPRGGGHGHTIVLSKNFSPPPTFTACSLPLYLSEKVASSL